jgi:hypothetical protein
MSQPDTAASSEPIVATAGQYYRNMRYIICAGLIALGLWFAYDGFIGWPKKNQQIADIEAQHAQATRVGEVSKAAQLLEQRNKLGEPKTDTDLFFQKLLGFALPPLGIAVVIWALYRSRGEYRLDGQTLHVPGHPPVPFENITDIDRHLWDRKGIAYISYDLGNGKQGRLKLDDFLYDRPPTDAIYERIDRFITGGASRPAASPAPEGGATDNANL